MGCSRCRKRDVLFMREVASRSHTSLVLVRTLLCHGARSHHDAGRLQVIEIAVIGAGVSGLALTRMLCRARRDVHVFEARDRMGGRVESAACTSAPTRLDLGPTWYWPRTQPLMTELVTGLGLRDFPQHDSGEALIVDDTDRPSPQYVQDILRDVDAVYREFARAADQLAGAAL